MTITKEDAAYIDRRDAQVVENLVVGETYPLGQMKNAYKRFTDTSRDTTAKRRAKNLFKTPAFEFVDYGKFRYTGLSQ